MTAMAAIIPLHSKEKPESKVVAEPPPPEPTTLYGLACLALFLHTSQHDTDVRCHEVRPCDQACLIRRTATKLIAVYQEPDDFKADGA